MVAATAAPTATAATALPDIVFSPFFLPVFGEGGVGFFAKGVGRRKSPTLPSPKTGREKRGAANYNPNT
jgi:hypothetical protein